MHFSCFEVFLITVCTISSVVHRSFVNGQTNSTEIKLKRPAFCVLFWGLSRLCYPGKLLKDDKQNFYFEIKEESSGNWANISNDQGSGIFNWTKFLNSTSKYQVRAVLGNITGPILEFHTNCSQQISPPTDFNVTYTGDETLELIWSHEDLDLNASNYCVKLVNSGKVPGIPIWKLYKKQPGQISGRSNDFAVVSTNSNGFMKLENMELSVPPEINPWSGEICTSSPTNCVIESLNITYGQKNSPIIVNVNRSSEQGEPINPSKNFHLEGNAFMTENHTIGRTGDASWPLQSNELYIIEVTVHDPISNVSALIKITFRTNKSPELLFWVLYVIMIVLLLSICLVCYRGYKNRRARMMGPMLIVKYRNSSSYRLMSQSDDSPFRFSAYLPYLREFESYVNDAAENGVLEYQFRSLPRGLTRPCQYGRLPQNKPKNRYGNLIPYDATRVILDQGSHKQYSDYINANYIHGYLKEKAYIATQGPLPGTIVDFWRMIWQEKVHIICMLVDLFEDGEKMCEQYWPEVDGTMDYDNVLVANVQQRVFAHYTYRTFWITTRSTEEMRKVEHLQYTGWPREGVPMYSHSVAEYLTKLRSIPAGEGPIVMHCSGGTGRTGAIILCDITLRHFAAEQKVDVFDEAKKMYRARANMLRTFPEYVLAHLAPSHCLLYLPTKVPCCQISPVRMAEMKMDLSVHMKRLDDCSWMDKALRPLGPLRPPPPENLVKNRFPELTPVGDILVTLTRYPTYDEHSNYISAVSVDGVRLLDQYLASQLPMPSTLTDFWRLVIEKNVELVIILQCPEPEDETCCIVVPRCSTVIPVPNVKVEVKMKSKTGKHFTTDILLLTDSSVKPARARTITTLTCNKWSYGEDSTPPPPEALVDLWVASENIRRVEGPTLVLCHNGVTGCGLYLALSFMLERMAVERECDVILAVRAVRRSRPEFVNSKTQFEYLYDAAVEYSESFRTYNNFR